MHSLTWFLSGQAARTGGVDSACDSDPVLEGVTAFPENFQPAPSRVTANLRCVMDLAFRFATAADVDAVVVLVESAYRGESSRAGWTTEADLLEGQRTDPAAVRETIEASDHEVLLAEAAGRLMACCELQRRGADTAYFGMFAVVPTLQGSGVGGQVLTEAERIAREDWQAEQMEMTVIAQRVELIDWYERRGYLATGERRPFPHHDERFGRPQRDDLEFVVLAKALG